MSNTPILGQMKGLMEIHNAVKFHQYSICGCQVMYFQKFSEEQRVQFLAASGWFLGKPKMRSTLYKIFTSDPLQGDAMDLI